MESSSGQRKLILGIDFGTLKTCVSYAFWNSNQKEPPGIDSLSIENTIVFPSCLAEENEEILWGRAASGRQDIRVYKWLKLFLYDPDHPILQDPDTPKVPMGYLPERLVTQYLGQLHNAIQKTMRKLYPDYNQGIDYWFGWPATWSDESRQKMRRAVEEAGYDQDPDRLFFVTEAEATALYFTHAFSGELRDGCVLICDIGGGTTDVAALKIHNSGKNPTYEQLSSYSGNDCGLAAMDAALREYARGLPGITTQRLLNGIVSVKRTFTGKEDQPILLQESGRHTAPPGDIKNCLNPTIVKIFNLILKNIDTSYRLQMPISHVLLTGGGGMMPYLRGQIEDKLQGMVDVLHLDEYAPISVAWGATRRGVLGRAIARLRFDRSYGLRPAAEAVIHEEDYRARIRPVKSTPPHWFVRKKQEYVTGRQENRFFHIFYHAGDLSTTIIHIVQHPGECPSPTDGVKLEEVGVFDFCLELQEFDPDILRTGDDYRIKVKIAWELKYSERQAGVELVATMNEKEIRRKLVPLREHELVY
ncbi:hypothetical protein ASPBRDRAFT_204224 [Aspergillus brasiliensis CBS 101740]|uniref:Actin-like ATPase domain-containing protein n=1 Tax=Aspergillus brasiliensis (strain CBS 101740 / IMI 381727 / IBT 21946) TaxID=767769 RepID=A0A1L9UY67_ASPBC|nr:hypothetical protein ASPBRDRAFT_204224 [Aspergillus brasiliensis CBS 101740]